MIDDIYEFAEAQGFEIDGITQEGGAGQVEINLRHGDPVKLADEVFYFKRLIREAALRHDCFATFMAKPIEGEPGTAMHIHHSVVDVKTGRNLFTGPHGGETDAFFHFIGGLQEHMPSVIADDRALREQLPPLRAATIAAPINLEWGRDNRTTGLRVPISEPEARRVENRLAGMDCNPYLVHRGLAGLRLSRHEEGDLAVAVLKGDAYTGDSEHEIPRSMFDALELFSEAPEIHDILGDEFSRVYQVVKRTEYDEFLQVISPWEREHLLLNV